MEIVIHISGVFLTVFCLCLAVYVGIQAVKLDSDGLGLLTVGLLLLSFVIFLVTMENTSSGLLTEPSKIPAKVKSVESGEVQEKD